jgi:hypothetical protein
MDLQRAALQRPREQFNEKQIRREVLEMIRTANSLFPSRTAPIE